VAGTVLLVEVIERGISGRESLAQEMRTARKRQQSMQTASPNIHLIDPPTVDELPEDQTLFSHSQT
jgi:hypothetical protein